MLPEAAVILDAGAFEWRCGWADDDGPSEIRAAAEMQQPREDYNGFSDIVHSLEGIDEVNEYAVIVSEPTNQTSESRERVAAAVFANQAAQAICCYPAPLLAIYNAGFDTGILVDVGYTATCIYLIYEGTPVLDGVTLHPLAGAHIPGESNADTSCEPLFDPRVLDGTCNKLCGVHDAIIRTLVLADVSLRPSLLAHVVVVGGGSKLTTFPEQLERQASGVHDMRPPHSSAALFVCRSLGGDTPPFAALGIGGGHNWAT